MAGSVRRLDTLQIAELAEGMEVQLRIAGPFLRFVAWFIDLAVTFGILIIMALLLFIGAGITGYDEGAFNVASGFFLLIWFVVWWFYPVLFEAGPKGATWGKRAVGLRVVNEGGTRITMGQAMVRNFVRGVEVFLPLLPLVAFFHPRFQRLGDLAAGTLVVYSRKRVDPIVHGPPSLTAVPVNRALTREEEADILSFRDRSGGWSEARRIELVDHLTGLTGHRGPKGVSQILGMAHWLEDRR